MFAWIFSPYMDGGVKELKGRIMAKQSVLESKPLVIDQAEKPNSLVSKSWKMSEEKIENVRKSKTMRCSTSKGQELFNDTDGEELN